MKINNIYSQGKEIKIFSRKENGELEIKIDNSFFPYFYEEDPNGEYKSYKGDTLRKIFASHPKDIMKRRTENAWEADILFCKRYIIDNVNTIEKSPIKYAMIDIETLSEEMPDKNIALDPISCITIYNSFSKEKKSYYLGNYNDDKELLKEFILYLQKEKFDLLIAWNMKGFDYPYLYNRIERIKDPQSRDNFANLISPINKSRYGNGEIWYPAGTSIIDYMEWDKKVTLNKRTAYGLDPVLEEELGQGKKYKNVDFSVLSEDILNRNIEDVEGMVKLEEKLKYIDYYDEIRRLAMVEWEDLDFNSRVIDLLLLQEAKKQKIVLPMKPFENEKEEYEGAFREAFETGRFFDIGKYDLSSAYPYAIIDFCLDPANIITSGYKGKEAVVEINGTEFEQDKEALLPTVVKRLINLKNDIKQTLDSTDFHSQDYKNVKRKYNAIKSVVNSAYGVMGNRFFRLYDKRVASATTYIVRSLLHYVKDKVEEKGYKVIYVDTDSVFIDSKEKLNDNLNDLIQQWAKEKFNKDKVEVEFAYEGIYEKLLIIAKCRYKGWLRTKKGIEIEVKGIEAKRKDSTVYMKKFQTELIDKIVNKELQKNIEIWVKEKLENIKKQQLQDIAFPCKMAKKIQDYKSIPIFARALSYTPELKKRIGSRFYYIYVNPMGYETKIVEKKLIQTYDKNGLEKGFKNLTGIRLIKAYEVNKIDLRRESDGQETTEEERLKQLSQKGLYKLETCEMKGKAKDVLAFDEETYEHINRDNVNWGKMSERNITNKSNVIFEAMGWKEQGLKIVIKRRKEDTKK